MLPAKPLPYLLRRRPHCVADICTAGNLLVKVFKKFAGSLVMDGPEAADDRPRAAAQQRLGEPGKLIARPNVGLTAQAGPHG